LTEVAMPYSIQCVFAEHSS